MKPKHGTCEVYGGPILALGSDPDPWTLIATALTRPLSWGLYEPDSGVNFVAAHASVIYEAQERTHEMDAKDAARMRVAPLWTLLPRHVAARRR